jgi:hypothetical protein
MSSREEHRLRVFWKSVLKRIIGGRRDEIIGGQRKLHNELCNLYCSLTIIRMIKSTRMSWAGHEACMGR